MKKFIHITLIMCLIAPMSIDMNAQIKNGTQVKLAKYFEKEQWEDLAFKSERMIMQDKYKNDAEVYLYLAYSYAKIFVMCLEDPKLLDKVPEYLNSYNFALKYSVTAKKKDKKAKLYFPENDDMLEEIAIIGMHYVDHYVSIKKYSKANAKVRKMLKTYTDENLLALNGSLAAITGDTARANPIFDELIKNSEKKRKEKKTDFAMLDAFDIYANYLLGLETPNTDSAKSVINLGFKYFPEDSVLMYDMEIANNPEYAAEHEKPENTRKTAIMKQTSVFGDDDEEENYEDEEDE